MTARSPPPQTPIVSVRIALALVGAVMLAHILVLRTLSEHLPAYNGQMSTRVFSTRTVQIRPPAKEVTKLPARPVSRVPKPKPAPAPVQPARPVTEGVLSATARAPAPHEPTLAPPLPVLPVLPSPPAETPVVAEEPAPPASAPEPAPVVASAEAPSAATSEPVVESPAQAPSEPLIAADAATGGRALTIPGSIRLAFEAVGKRGNLDYKAMGNLTWLQDGSHYDMRLEMGDWIIGTRVLSSTGDITGAGLAPTRYSDKFRSERAAHFDRQQGRITFSANTPQAELEPGAQDQLSIFAQLAAMVGGDPLAFPIGTTVTIQTAGTRHAEEWVFTVEREEMLYLPGGHVPALKLVRLPSKDYGQKIELWLAPELGFLPARIKVTFANGDYLDQQWKSSSSP